MKILIFSGAFFPSESPRGFRTTELAKELSREGHDVKVVVFTPNPILVSFDYGGFSKENNLTVEIIRQRWHLPESQSFFARLYTRVMTQYAAFPDIQIMRLLPKVLRREGKYDVLISIAVPHQIHWAIALCGEKELRKHCDTWIADCGDPFMLCGTLSFKPPFYFRNTEKRWCRMCDFITVPTEGARGGYYPEFREKTRVIPQGFNYEETPIAEYQKNSMPTFAYAGGFLKNVRDPRAFLEFLSSLDKPFRFIIYGKGLQLVEPYREKLGAKLVLKDTIPRRDLLMKLSQMDFLINIGYGTTVQTPSKLIDYTLAKRPILTIEQGDLKKDVFMEFLGGDYRHKDAEIDISKSDIRNVAKAFLKLCMKP